MTASDRPGSEAAAPAILMPIRPPWRPGRRQRSLVAGWRKAPGRRAAAARAVRVDTEGEEQRHDEPRDHPERVHAESAAFLVPVRRNGNRASSERRAAGRRASDQRRKGSQIRAARDTCAPQAGQRTNREELRASRGRGLGSLSVARAASGTETVRGGDRISQLEQRGNGGSFHRLRPVGRRRPYRSLVFRVVDRAAHAAHAHGGPLCRAPARPASRRRPRPSLPARSPSGRPSAPLASAGRIRPSIGPESWPSSFSRRCTRISSRLTAPIHRFGLRSERFGLHRADYREAGRRGCRRAGRSAPCYAPS